MSQSLKSAVGGNQTMYAGKTFLGLFSFASVLVFVLSVILIGSRANGRQNQGEIGRAQVFGAVAKR